MIVTVGWVERSDTQNQNDGYHFVQPNLRLLVPLCALTAPGIKKLCVPAYNFQKHLKRQNGSRNDALFIDFCICIVRICCKFNIYNPPNLNLP